MSEEQMMVNYITGEHHTKGEWLAMFGDDLIHEDGWEIDYTKHDNSYCVTVGNQSSLFYCLYEAQGALWNMLYSVAV